MLSWANKRESEAEERSLSRSSSLSGDALRIKMCGCQSKEERLTNRAAASSTRETGTAGHAQICSRQVLLLLGCLGKGSIGNGERVIKCAIDPLREILG